MEIGVIYNAGEAGLALDKVTGRELWSSGKGSAGYGTPVPFALAGKPALALFGLREVIVVDPASGKEQWRHPWKTRYDVNAADPVILGDTMVLTSGYGTGACGLQFTPSGARQLWKNQSLRSHMQAPIGIGGHIYGIDGDGGDGKARLKCLEASTGKVTWESPEAETGVRSAADGKLIWVTGKGELIIVKADPGGLSGGRTRPGDPRQGVVHAGPARRAPLHPQLEGRTAVPRCQRQRLGFLRTLLGDALQFSVPVGVNLGGNVSGFAATPPLPVSSALEFHYREGGIHFPRLGLWMDPHRAVDAGEWVVVTHAHADHTARHKAVILTEPTRRLMRSRLPGSRIEQVLAYSQAWTGDGRTRPGPSPTFALTLHPAGHVLGSAMVHLSAGDDSLLYTGDFKLRPGREFRTLPTGPMPGP
jgi:hypothetical protein